MTKANRIVGVSMSTEERLRDYLKRATVDLRHARARIEALETHEPIAIIGMACRLPGGVSSPEDLWRLLEHGTDAISEFPRDRGWDLDNLYHPDPENPGTSYAEGGGFLGAVSSFDAGFFGISPREALAMDPQQRLLLETSWEALERAGIDRRALKGSRTAVFVGGSHTGYGIGVGPLPDGVEGYSLTGSVGSVLSGRVSYALGLEGPSVTVDTACSSSLVALHLAAQALRQGECTMAVAGGVTVMPTPTVFIEFSRQRGLSPDGRCKSFADAADGTGWSEGVCTVLLERLPDAVRNGHSVLAVVRGSAVNSDGASNGLTAPNGRSQRRVILAALADAGLSASDVDAVEAHGTGTTLGDPIEAQALLAAYGKGRDPEFPLLLGALKSSIGHTQAAAGVAGVIKTVLAMQHGLLPKTLHVDRPTTQVDWSSGGVRLVMDHTPWPDTGRRRRAGVSAFGASGTNAHVILEEAPASDASGSNGLGGIPSVSGALPFLVSGQGDEALRRQAARLRSYLQCDADLVLADVAYSLASTRTAFSDRAVVLAADRESFVSGLTALAAGVSVANVVQGAIQRAGRGVVLVFPGQGWQWVGMAVPLLKSSPVFATRIAQCQAALSPFVDWSLTEVLTSAEDDWLDQVEVVQPVLWAVMVALAELWRSVGVHPAAVVGHSQGEVAAATVTGALSLEDAARIITARSKAIRALAAPGAMVSVALPIDDVEELLTTTGGEDLWVAAINGPASVVVSGGVAAVEELLAHCETHGIRARRIPVDYASHSGYMDALESDLAERLTGIEPRTSTVAFYSTVTATTLNTTELTAQYWFTNLRRTVRFDDTIGALLADGYTTFIETSAHPVLTGSLQDTFEDAASAAVALGTLRRDEDCTQRFHLALAEAHVSGIAVDWSALFAGRGARRIDLPTYAFQQERYWLGDETPAAGDNAVLPTAVTQESRFWRVVEAGDPEALTELLDVEDNDPASLGALLPVLSAWRRQERREAVLDARRYQVLWRPLSERPIARLSGTWLVLTLEQGKPLAIECLEALATHGASPVLVTVDATALDRLRLAARLTETMDESGIDRVTGVISLMGLAEDAHPEHSALSQGVAGLIVLAQALSDLELDTRLWCFTSGAVSVSRVDVLRNPAQARVWGLGRVVGLEYPRLWGGLVDLPAEVDALTWSQVVRIVSGTAMEDQVAVRDASTHVRRVVRAGTGEKGSRQNWVPSGTILVTGGTGGLGAQVARWAAAQGADHVVLTSRAGIDAPGAAELRAELVALGSRVSVCACDLADRDEVSELIARLDADRSKLTAVVHAAGVGQASGLANTDLVESNRLAAGKVAGAANLDFVLGNRPLDAFVLFSSISSIWGSGQQAVYASSNAYLDALAEHRRGRGATATSIVWGPWFGAGMADDELAHDVLARRGVRMLDPELSIAAMARAVGLNETVIVWADIDWERFAVGFTAVRPSCLFNEIAEVQRVVAAANPPVDPTTGGVSALANRLARAHAAEHKTIVLDLVRGQVADVLGHRSITEVGPNHAFNELGFDSLTAVELRNRLKKVTGLALPATMVFDHPTPRALADYVLDEIGDSSDVPDSPVGVNAVSGHEPIAIIGMACRFPGGIASPEQLWELVDSGADAISGFPEDRGWDLDVLYDPDPERKGTSYTCEGGFLDAAGDFDAAFFGISPREALAMDPQQRLLLETTWEAFERARIDHDTLRGSQTAVFVGGSPTGYGTGVRALPQGVEGYALTGNAGSVMSGRISYLLGLGATSMTVDTGCSSSLVALHMASQALRQGECTLAVAGGVSLTATTGGFVEFSRQRALAKDGRCKAFSAAADGMGWSEGVGVLIVERLSDAHANGHPVLAVVRGSAVNQDGASNGLTAPNGPSQQRVIRQALANARLNTDDVDAVEGHGTGTTLGDPIEVQALMATYGRGREIPLWLGSIKSNIGHTTAAAGAAGVIKMVLAMQHGVLPKTLHAEIPTPHADWSSGAIEILRDARPWPATERPRRAGVSSFGISGTNAHLILEEAPAPPESTLDNGSSRHILARNGAILPFAVSGKGVDGLRGQARRLLPLLQAQESPDLGDLAYSLVATRPALEHRGVVMAADRDGLIRGLTGLAAGEPAAGVVVGKITQDPRVVFVFPGQGSQWAGMARELLESSVVFAERIAVCERALTSFVDWSLTDVLNCSDAEWLDRVDVVQPVLWAVMVSLAELWRSIGVEPAAVMGHSQGEIAAACVAGALSVEDAAKVVALRSKAIQSLSGRRGAMVGVPLPVDRVGELIAPWADAISVAAVNGPESIVVSGDGAALDELVTLCEANGVRARRLPVDYASHSRHVDAIEQRITDTLDGLDPVQAAVPFYSAVTAGKLDTAELDAGYWFANLRRTVNFDQVVRAALGDGYTAFLEVSPHPVLITGVQDIIEDVGTEAVTLSTLRRDEDARVRFLSSMAEAHVHGLPVRWSSVLDGRAVDLPTYAFQRQRYWLESETAAMGDAAAVGLSQAGHPLLNGVTVLPDIGGVLLTGRLSITSHPWLAHHAVAGTVLLPGTAFLELAVRAGDEVGCRRIDELTIETPLILPPKGAVMIQVFAGAADSSGRHPVAVHSRVEGADGDQSWLRHAVGVLSSAGVAEDFDLAQWPPSEADELDVGDFYALAAESGYEYGPAFQGLRSVWRRGDEVFADVALPQEQSAADFGLHPALLDAALQAFAFAGSADGRMLLPFAWSGVSLEAHGATELRVRLTPTGGDGLVVRVADAAGRPVASAESLVLRPVAATQLTNADDTSRNGMFMLDWRPLDTTATAESWVTVGAPIPNLVAATGVPEEYADLAELAAGVDKGASLPNFVMHAARAPEKVLSPSSVHDATNSALGVVQSWVADKRFAASRLVVVTTGAVSARPGDAVPGLAQAAVSGLVISAQNEHPGRILLVDVDDHPDSATALCAAAAAAGVHEPRIAIREGVALVPKVARAHQTTTSLAPPTGAWRLDTIRAGTFDNLVLLTSHADDFPLGPGEVRVAVRAAGLNFRDVLIALGMYPGDALIGGECAGVVTEAGSEVTDLSPGDRVFGLCQGGCGTVVIADRRTVARIPAGWSFERAAATAVAFLTAWHGLIGIAKLTAGEAVLVHAAAGGVGMAAVGIAKHLGAEVFATASPGKWGALRALGLDDAHIASSRNLDFEAKFRDATGGKGVRVVLNSLVGEFVDASLRLLSPDGRFVEIGKTDIRDQAAIRTDRPGISYQAFDLITEGPDVIAGLFDGVMAAFESGGLDAIPVRAWDVRRARDAFRFMSNAQHVGKIVLTMPAQLNPEGTVLVTGGMGTLGALVARHLVINHGVRHLLLTGRRGLETPGAITLRDKIVADGATVTIEACDVGDREALAGLLSRVERPLTAVVHAAGILRDGVLQGLTSDQVSQVLRSKVDAALHLHELTAGCDLAAFVLFSSFAGTVGSAGQANYAAANTFLDALAGHRRTLGLPATSLAWGLWETDSGLTEALAEADRTRMARGGVLPLSTQQGLALFDSALAMDEALLAPVRFDPRTLNAEAVPPVLRSLIKGPIRRPTGAALEDEGRALRGRLGKMGRIERLEVLSELVRANVAAVLGHGTASAVDADSSFRDLGFDSLTAVELRNRVASATGLRLAPTLVFDYPSPTKMADYLGAELIPLAQPTAVAGDEREEQMRKALHQLPVARLAEAGLLDALLKLAGRADLIEGAGASDTSDEAASIAGMDVSALVDLALNSLDVP